jgi:hypothetical protein
MFGVSYVRTGLGTLLAAAFLAGASVGASPGPGPPAPLAKGWGWLLASGTISGVDPAARTITVAIIGQGRVEVFEGGTTWRHRAVTGAHLVHVLPATVVADARDKPAPFASLLAGTPALVWGVVRAEGPVLALKVMMPQFSVQPYAEKPTGPGTSGVVLRRSGGMLDLLTAQGTRRTVLVTGTTVVRSPASSTLPAAIAPYDLVRVEGLVNSDGSIAATRIDMEFGAATAAQLSGTVEQRLGDVLGLVVDGVMVPLSAETYFVRGSGPGTFEQLAPGQPVVVYGVPISSGSTPIGLRARLVVLR